MTENIPKKLYNAFFDKTKNAIAFPNRTIMRIIQVSKNGSESETKLMKGLNETEFMAVFKEEDVDFQIEIDNRLSLNGFSFNIDFSESVFEFYVPPNGYSTLETIKSNGRKLHLIKQTSREGRLLLAQTMEEKGISFNEASIRSSRIGFNVEIEKQKGVKIRIYCYEFGSDYIVITMELNKTVEYLRKVIIQKLMFKQKSDLSTGSRSSSKLTKIEEFRLERNGMHMIDNRLIEDYVSQYVKVPTFHMVYPLYGGGGGRPSSQLIAKRKIGFKRDSSGNLIVLQRGLICFGDKSSQKFTNYYDFEEDSDYMINSFSIELQINSNYRRVDF